MNETRILRDNDGLITSVFKGSEHWVATGKIYNDFMGNPHCEMKLSYPQEGHGRKCTVRLDGKGLENVVEVDRV
ncbi:MAG: hypothetical protein JSS89_13375 [Bacteroidetes bacterium]|nr:hypothetical protein [Bacteroidota bacterium]